MMKSNGYIAYNRPDIGDKEIKAVVGVLRSGWLTMGEKTLEFEQKFAEYIGVKYAIAVNSCTAALHLALLAHGVGEGDEVILPSFTFAASANVVVHCGARPVFADIDPVSFNLDPDDVESRITKKTKAIIVVHFAGQAADISRFKQISKKYKLSLIEDAAHALGSEYKGRLIGSHGLSTCFSFYATKNITTGEGGMLTTNNAKIADFARVNRLHGISKDAWKRYSKNGNWRYKVVNAGYKYNMIDLQAVLGIVQLKKLASYTAKRRSLAGVYTRLLGNQDELSLPVEQKGRLHCYHLFPVIVKLGKRDEFVEKLKDNGIGSSVHFIPLHLMPYYMKRFVLTKGRLPVTEKVYQSIVSLPLYPLLTKTKVARIARVIMS